MNFFYLALILFFRRIWIVSLHYFSPSKIVVLFLERNGLFLNCLINLIAWRAISFLSMQQNWKQLPPQFVWLYFLFHRKRLSEKLFPITIIGKKRLSKILLEILSRFLQALLNIIFILKKKKFFLSNSL